MATIETLPESHGTHSHPHRRRPFSTWVKKLASFKSSSDGERPKMKRKTKRNGKQNNPYPESGVVGNGNAANGAVDGESANSFTTGQTTSDSSLRQSVPACTEDNHPTTAGGRSMANTVSTDQEGSQSITSPSHGASSLAGTNPTVGGGQESRVGGDSTFSSPAPSVRSLTTTLTTIQSLAQNGTSSASQGQSNNTQSIQFSQPFPTASPASAIPAHLAPSGNPTTYTTATANNLLTDNASILTLASSSKRRRRRSMDTDASVRALAPSSLWGGSRESLPLSVLSANVDGGVAPTTPGLHNSSSRIGAERNSIYSATGVAPAIPSDRNSVYTKQGDGASVRSGAPGHVRGDSYGGSNSIVSPLASPRPVQGDKVELIEKEDGSEEGKGA